METVAEGRKLSPATVRSFADGRVFTGEQAVELGLVDRIGTEEDARVYAAELVGLDPKTTKVFTIKPPKSFASKFLPSGSENAIARLQFESETSCLPLWMLP